jgi:hypothetical protein
MSVMKHFNLEINNNQRDVSTTNLKEMQIPFLPLKKQSASGNLHANITLKQKTYLQEFRKSEISNRS